MDILKTHPQWHDVVKICTRLREAGFTAWLAGGCVRDGLLGILPHDFDIATNARPKKIESFFNKTVDVGKAFGVIRVVEKSGDIEVAMFRRESGYADGRRPDTVELATPQEDARRRDFTINAMFYDLFEGEIHDYVNGMQDLNAKVIRTVGVAEDRFMEDKLRVLRAVRFVAQLGFNLDPLTWSAVGKFSSLLSQISWERIHEELNKLFHGRWSDRGLELMLQSGLMSALIPEVEDAEVLPAAFGKLTDSSARELCSWLLLFDRITNAESHDKVFKRLKFSGQKCQSIRSGIEIMTTMRIWDRISLADRKKVAAEGEAVAAFLALGALGELDNDKIQEFLVQNKNLPKRLLEAHDILAIGIPQGKQVGELLDRAFDAQLEGKIKTRGDALEWVKKQKE
ncbi:MAG: CCA tRNA nucleotidyltransferase [Oligoflexia bacterium]|nr:CCA tRNA nucleotidyltransferase [Oligoflexia bacterium]